ncbi:MAG: XRE family transcriptional regulator [Proteobacteria bacterium]|nr:MAG: XRE family transcriptional regulator [Pseudomonadota bacterium]PIE67073.1 MAG: XRE family transcriptional regulator [Deltaproteobacteria bacterium]
MNSPSSNITAKTGGEIWVFGDLRSRQLLDSSFQVLAKAAGLAGEIGDRLVLFLLTNGPPEPLTSSQGDACTMDGTVDDEAFARGANEVRYFENDRFETPTPHLCADALSPIIKEKAPRLVLFPLTDFGRELAARVSASAGSGLIADCVELAVGKDGSIVGLCPAWGGKIMSEITFAPGWGTGFATVQPHGAKSRLNTSGKGSVVREIVDTVPTNDSIRRVSTQSARPAEDDLESARTVVVGGAGLGSVENFGKARQLARALAGQVGATRPPVLNHWVAENRLIGQTGKTVRPKLLITIGTSGAVQYTAGITDAGTIVAIDRDPSAPIFQLADIGVVAEVSTFLPLLIARTRQAVMRQLADDACSEGLDTSRKTGFGEKLKILRETQGWSREHLAKITGQTPEFIASVESGDFSPPVAFILRLSQAYQVDPDTFLRDEERSRIRNQRTEAYVKRTGNNAYQSLTSGAENDHLRAFMVTIEPHQDHKPVAYKHEGEEFIFVMEGELEVTLGNKPQVLKKEDSIHFHSNTPHKLKSLSSEITRCLVLLYTI